MRRVIRFFILLLLASAFSWNCATIMNGTHQEIEVASSPLGATVWIDSNRVGVTPLTVNLKRNTEPVVRVELAGYEQAQFKVTKKMSAWVLCNAVIPSVFVPLQLAIDLISGGVWSLSVDQLYVRLEKESVGLLDNPREPKTTEAADKEDRP